MSTELSEKSKDLLKSALKHHLDTRDKRFMFLRILYPEILKYGYIDLDGSPTLAAFNIIEEFIKRGKLEELARSIAYFFQEDLILPKQNK